MLRSLVLTSALTVALALPAAAQQAISEQEARQVAQSALEFWNKAFAARDAARLAAQYTEDYVMVGPPGWPKAPDGTMSGRATMEKNWSDNFMAYAPNPDTLVQVSPIGRDAIWVVFTWSGIYNSPKGPEQEKGLTARVYVRDGDGWKIRKEMWNSAAPS